MMPILFVTGPSFAYLGYILERNINWKKIKILIRILKRACFFIVILFLEMNFFSHLPEDKKMFTVALFIKQNVDNNLNISQ